MTLHCAVGNVRGSRRKNDEAEPPCQEGQSKRQRMTEESNAHAERPPHIHEGLAQLLGLASDQNPSNPEPGPVDAAPLRADSFIAPYPQPSVVQPHPLALPASAPPQGEAAREDEPEVEFDTDQFLN
jgi:hypothetical protein